MISTIAAVLTTTNQLDDGELAALNLLALADWDPQQYPVYEKAKALFTEQGGTRMHPDTKDALASIVNRRLA